MADLSQARVADLMGVDRAYISALERGERNPTVLSLWQVSEALGVKMAQLVEETEEVTTAPSVKQRASKTRSL